MCTVCTVCTGESGNNLGTTRQEHQSAFFSLFEKSSLTDLELTKVRLAGHRASELPQLDSGKETHILEHFTCYSKNLGIFVPLKTQNYYENVFILTPGVGMWGCLRLSAVTMT